MKNPDHAKSVGLLLLAALCWSLGGVLIKSIHWTPLAVAGGRGLIAAVFLAAAAWPRMRFTWSFTQLGGAVAYAACTVLFVLATKLTTAANAILLQYTAPIYIALLGAWFLGERARWIDWVTIAIELGGMALFFADRLQLAGVIGNLVAIASGVAFAAMTLFLRKGRETALEAIFLGNILAGLVGLPFMLAAALPGAQSCVALLLLGSVQLGLSYLFYAKAIRHVTALEAVLIPVVEPILNPLWVLLLIGERPGRFALLGGIIVLGAATVRAVIAIRQRPDALPALPVAD